MGTDTREPEEGNAVKLSVPKPHVFALVGVASLVACLFWLPFLVLTDLGVSFIEVDFGLVSSANGCHCFGSGLGVFLPYNPCWRS